MGEFIRANWIALLALIVSLISLSYTHRQIELSRSQAHLHLEPQLSTYFDAPPEGNPVFVISNEGDIPATSVSVLGRLYVYDKARQKIVSAASMGHVFSPGAIYREELKPADHESLGLLGVNPQPHILVLYEFVIRYFRQSDMREFTRTEYFFVDSGIYIPHAEFVESEHYKKLMAAAEGVEMPEPEWSQGALRKYLDATEETK